MRLLVDECTGPALARWLRAQQHEVFSDYEEASDIDDDEVIRRAFAENRILIANYRDFGAKGHHEQPPREGVVLLRLADGRPAIKIDVLEKLLSVYADRIPGRFVVVTETKIRFVRLSPAEYMQPCPSRTTE